MRGVAARAGVGASTLRHYFPTQRELLDTVLRTVYETAIPDQRIRDTSIPARERLIECVWSLLEPIGVGEQSRETWKKIFDLFIAPEATDDARTGFLVLVRQAEQRVLSWFAILEDEGALPPGDNVRRTHYLLTVADGLSIGRALPSSGSRVEEEAFALAVAVDTVLGPFPRP